MECRMKAADVMTSKVISTGPKAPIKDAPISDRFPTNLREALMSSAVTSKRTRAVEREVLVGSLRLPGNLTVPAGAHSLGFFAHGSGSSRLSPRNRAVATALNEQGIATLLFDLLTPEEEEDRS